MATTGTSAIENNGVVPDVIDEQQIIDSLRGAIAARTAYRDELVAEATRIGLEIRRYERALAPLLNEDKPRKDRPASAPKRTKGIKVGTGSIGEERVKEIEDAILDYASDHDEFRQVDVRGRIGYSSSVMSQGFEALRQTGVIRFARREGSQKFFRLTTEGLAKVKHSE